MPVARDRTKVIVRKLPPGLTEEGFRAAVDKVAAGTYTWLCYFQGKVSMKRATLSRGYINFSDPHHVLAFKAAFDGHSFVTTKGTQYRAQVEYAPYQKVPAPPLKRNPLEGTIEKDPDYIAFLEALEAGPALLPSAAAQREAAERTAVAAGTASGAGVGTDTGPIVTPLMQYLKERHAAAGPGKKLPGRGKPGPPQAQATRTGEGPVRVDPGVSPMGQAERHTTAAPGRGGGGAGSKDNAAARQAGRGAGRGGPGLPVPPKGGGKAPGASTDAPATSPAPKPPTVLLGRQPGPSRPTSASAGLPSGSQSAAKPPANSSVTPLTPQQAARAAGRPAGAATTAPPVSAAPAAAAAVPAPAASNGDVSSGAVAPVAAPAPPARRVRAGFQAYRPPSAKPGGGGDA